jgi:hypothetical protein
MRMHKISYKSINLIILTCQHQKRTHIMCFFKAAVHKQEVLREKRRRNYEGNGI